MTYATTVVDNVQAIHVDQWTTLLATRRSEFFRIRKKAYFAASYVSVSLLSDQWSVGHTYMDEQDRGNDETW